MEPDDRKALYRVLSLAEENNAMLRRMRSAQKNASTFRAIYWVVVIGLLIGSYYVVKPYMTSLENLYASVKGTTTGGLQMPTAADIQNMVSQYKAKQ